MHTYDYEEEKRAILKLKAFGEGYRGKRKTFLLIGPFGSGKSWCLRQAFGDNVVNLSLEFAQVTAKEFPNPTERRKMSLEQIGEVMLQCYEDILKNSDEPIVLDNIELLYSYPYFDFITVAERSFPSKSIVISIPGYVLDQKIYFIDEKFEFDLRIDPTRVDRFFELKGRQA